MKKSFQEKAKKINQKAFFISIAVAFSLSLIKGIAALLTGSAGLLASAFDSFFDTLVSSGNALISFLAQKPADENHTFGHGKFEAFAAFLQSILIAVSGVFLIRQSIHRFLHPQSMESEFWGVVAMVFSFFATFLLVRYQRHVAEKTHSLSIQSDSSHFTTDLLANAAVIIGILAFSFWGVLWVDTLVCAIGAFFLFQTAWKLFQESFFILTDHELSSEVREKIMMILNEETREKIYGWHDLRTRKSGSEMHIDFHLEFENNISLQEAHDYSEKIEEKILKIFPLSHLLVHFDTQKTP